MQLAEKTLSKELDVVSLIRMQRCFKMILEMLFTQEEHEELVQSSKYVEIDPDHGSVKVKAPSFTHE